MQSQWNTESTPGDEPHSVAPGANMSRRRLASVAVGSLAGITVAGAAVAGAFSGTAAAEGTTDLSPDVECAAGAYWSAPADVIRYDELHTIASQN